MTIIRFLECLKDKGVLLDYKVGDRADLGPSGEITLHVDMTFKPIEVGPK